MKNNLLLHTGAHSASYGDVCNTATPEPRGAWHPVPHHSLVAQVRRGLSAAGMEVVGEAHALNRKGAHYFGLLQVAVDGREGDEWGTVVGLRNSHDKCFAASLALGTSLFVCDNLSFTGQVVLARKHTANIMRDLPGVAARAIGKLREFSGVAGRRADAYKERGLGDAEAHDLVIRALDARAVTTLQVPKVLARWRHPGHTAFDARNMWSLYNAFTDVYKGNLLQLPARSQALHGVLDTAAGLALPS